MSVKKCPECGQTIKSRRSTDISNRFNGWVTFLSRVSERPREQVYFEVLLLATENVADGGDPYPYVIMDREITSPITGQKTTIPMAEPLPTSSRTNKEMMTACEACWWWLAERQQEGELLDVMLPEDP